MTNQRDAVIIRRRTPESETFVANVRRAMRITPVINRLTFDDAEEVRALFSELIGQQVDESFRLIPPFFTDCGLRIRVGRRVFINQNCTLYDLAEIRIGDDVMIGPNVGIITSQHPVEPTERHAYVFGRPVVIGNGVWIAANATIIGGVTIGENAVVAAGSVVTRDVPANSLVGGNPARVIRLLDQD